MLEQILEFVKEHHPTYKEIVEHFKDSEVEALNYFLRVLEQNGDIIKVKSNYVLPRELGLVAGTITAIKPRFAFATISEEEDVYISLHNLKTAFLSDRVLLKKISTRFDHKSEYEVMYVTKRANEFVVGEVDEIGNKKYLIVDKIAPKNYLFKIKDNGIAVANHQIVKAKIVNINLSFAEVEVVTALGNKLDIGMDITRIILSNGAPMEFPDDVMKEVSNIPDHVEKSEKVGREDFTSHVIVTIDGDDAKDFDDAVEAKKVGDNYQIGVHIADVAHYVKKDQPLDVEALNRATSLYVQDRVVPMLPFQLSNGICSLNPNVERLVTSCIFTIDKSGNVLDSKICKGVIKSYKRCTYNEVNHFLKVERYQKDPSEYSEVEKLWINLLDAASIIRKKRQKMGGLELESVELKFKINSEGQPYDVEKRKQDVGEELIEDLMIKANEIVASTIERKKLPMVFRIHEKPRAKRLEAYKIISEFKGYPCHLDPLNCSPKDVSVYLDTIKDENDKEILSSLLLRCLAKAKYSTQNKKHFGLASSSYCHFTSPIRRYPDLLVHRLIDRYFVEGDTSFNDDFKTMLSLRADLSSQRERRALTIERATDSLLSCKLMKPFIGEKYLTKIVSMTDKGMFLQLDNGIEGFISFESLKDDYYIFDEETYIARGKRRGKIYHLGDSLEVILDLVDLDKAQITFVTEKTKKEVDNFYLPHRRRNGKRR